MIQITIERVWKHRIHELKDCYYKGSKIVTITLLRNARQFCIETVDDIVYASHGETIEVDMSHNDAQDA